MRSAVALTLVITSFLLCGCTLEDAEGFVCAFVTVYGGASIHACERPSPSAGLSMDSPPVVTTPATADFVGNLFFPQVAAGGGYTTTMSFLHTDARRAVPAVGKLHFYSPDGSLRTVSTPELGTGAEFDLSIPAGGVRVITVTSQGPLLVGSARFDASDVSVGGVAVFTAGAAVIGVPAAEPLSIGYVPLNTRAGFSNGVAIQNAGSGPLNLELRLLRPDGSVDQTSRPPEVNPLPVNGQYSRFIEEMGFAASVKPDSTLVIESLNSQTFAAVPLVLGNGLISTSALVSTDNESPLVFPQIADGGGYTTSIRLFNPNNTAADGTLRFYTTTGLPRTISLVSRGTGSSFPISIPAHGTLVLETAGAPVINIGMARIDSLYAIGGVATIYSGQNHVGVPSSTRMRSARIAVNTTSGQNTGVAVAPGFAGTNLTLTLQNRDGSGNQSVALLLPANGQNARYVSEMGFSNTSELRDSSLRMEAQSDGAFVPMALLDRNGVFSSTAVARQRLFESSSYAGYFSGEWTNDQNGDGDLFLSFGVDPNTNTVTGMLTIDISDLGITTPLTLPVSGTVSRKGVVASVGNGTLTIKADGTANIRANLVSGFTSTELNLIGYFDGTAFSGTFEFKSSAPNPVVSITGNWYLKK